MTPASGGKAGIGAVRGGSLPALLQGAKGSVFRAQISVFLPPLGAMERSRTTLCPKYQANRLTTWLSNEKRAYGREQKSRDLSGKNTIEPLPLARRGNVILDINY